MQDEFIKQLTLDGDTFEQVKRDFNFVLQRLLGNMQEKEAMEGSMTLKLEVSLDNEYIPNYDPKIEGESRKIQKPKFKHKITSTVQIKDEKGGNMDTEMELVMDEETGCYVLKPIANTSQRSIFDADFREAPAEDVVVDGDGNPIEADGNALPGRKIMGLPGPAEEDIVDAEVREVAPESPNPDENPEAYISSGEDEETELEDATDALFGNMNAPEEDIAPGDLPFAQGDDEDYGYQEPEEE